MTLKPITVALRAGIGLTGLILLPLAGCAVGPDFFQKPAPPDVSGYTAQPLAPTAAIPGVAGGDAQSFVPATDIAGDWWTLFHSKALDALIQQSLKNNPDLKAAQAALTAAHEDAWRNKASTTPAPLGISATRQRQPGVLAPVPSNKALYNLYTAQVNISYSPDLFGLNRRTVESLQAQEQGVRFQMIAAWTTLITNVVVTAVQLAALQDQVDATQQMVDANKQMLESCTTSTTRAMPVRSMWRPRRRNSRRLNATLPPLVKQLEQIARSAGGVGGRFPGRCARAAFRSRTCSYRKTCRSACPRSSWSNARTCSRPKPTCTPPAPRSASRRPTACPTSS